LKSKSQTLETHPDVMAGQFDEPQVLDLTCSLLHQSDIAAKALPGDSSSWLEALCAANGAQRLEFWEAIERLAQGLIRHRRTNISLQRSRVLLTASVLRGAVLVTPDAIPRVEHVLVDAQLDRREIGSLLLASALESLRASGMQQVTARAQKDDQELITLLQAFGFTA
jgi:ribosomal protein S18 acetylase RimI-like enzyme